MDDDRHHPQDVYKRQYLERGDNVVGNARSAERLAHAARQLGNPPRFLGVAGDIGHPDTCLLYTSRCV